MLRATLIGSVGLWVALVGLVNILFISLQARARELGLLRALGATRGRIARASVAEGFAIAAVGGIAGCLLAWGLARTLGAAARVPVAIPPAWAAIVFTCTVVACCLAALLPASQAASVDPAEALRTE
jgi:putative ABC transport system permease protein